MKDKTTLTVKSREHSWSCQYFGKKKPKKNQDMCHLCPYDTKTVCEDCYHDSCSPTKLSPEQTDTEDKKWHQLKDPKGINKNMRSNRSTGSTDLELCHNQSEANHHTAAWQQWLEVSGEQANSAAMYKYCDGLPPMHCTNISEITQTLLFSVHLIHFYNAEVLMFCCCLALGGRCRQLCL